MQYPKGVKTGVWSSIWDQPTAFQYQAQQDLQSPWNCPVHDQTSPLAFSWKVGKVLESLGMREGFALIILYPLYPYPYGI